MAGYRGDCLMNMGFFEYVYMLVMTLSEAEKVGMQTLSGTPNDNRAVHAVLHALEGRVRTTHFTHVCRVDVVKLNDSYVRQLVHGLIILLIISKGRFWNITFSHIK